LRLDCIQEIEIEIEIEKEKRKNSFLFTFLFVHFKSNYSFKSFVMLCLRTIAAFSS